MLESGKDEDGGAPLSPCGDVGDAGALRQGEVGVSRQLFAVR